MATNNLILITATVITCTGLSVQSYLESSPAACSKPLPAEHCIETSYGPALLPLVESSAPFPEKRVIKTKRKNSTCETRVTKSTRKPSAAKCEAVRKSETRVAPTFEQGDAAKATIGM